MPNHIKNRVTLNGSKEQIKELITALSTFYPSEPSKTHSGSLNYRTRDNSAFGWLNPETNVFVRRNEVDTIGVPEGFRAFFYRRMDTFS